MTKGHTMFTRRAVAALGLIASVSLVAACGGGVQPGQSTEDGGGGAPASGASAWSLTGGVGETLITDSFERWNADSPDQAIAHELFANDAYKEKIRTAVGAGNAPTLIYSWGGGGLADYVDGGAVVDITAGTEDVLGRVLPSVADGGIIDGKVYGIPNNQSQPVILYYNQALFDQVGAQPPTTWAELMDVVGAFNEAGIAPFALAGQSKWPYLMWIQYLTDRIGGPEVFQRVIDNEPGAWSDPAITSALEHIQELVQADGFVNGYGSVVADNSADVALLYTGKAAMLLQGAWVYSRFLSDAPDFVSSGDLGFSGFPTVDGGAGDPANIVGNINNYWSVSADASPEDQQIAIDYLNTILYDDTYTQILLEGGGVPPVVGMEDAIGQTADAAFIGMAYDMVRDAPHFQLSWDQALPPEPAQELLTNLDKIFLLQSTPQEFVDAMNATIG